MDDFGLGHDRVALTSEHLAQRGRDVGWGEHGRCHLVQEGLKEVVVVTIDQNDLRARAPEGLDGAKASKSASDDDDARPIMLRRLESIVLLDIVGRLYLRHFSSSPVLLWMSGQHATARHFAPVPRRVGSILGRFHLFQPRPTPVEATAAKVACGEGRNQGGRWRPSSVFLATWKRHAAAFTERPPV
jgi:hypothetical protein